MMSLRGSGGGFENGWPGISRVGGGAPRSTEGSGGKDSWLEFGPTASFGLTNSLHVDLAATRTFGLRAGDGTSASAALRLAF